MLSPHQGFVEARGTSTTNDFRKERRNLTPPIFCRRNAVRHKNGRRGRKGVWNHYALLAPDGRGEAHVGELRRDRAARDWSTNEEDSW